MATSDDFGLESWNGMKYTKGIGEEVARQMNKRKYKY